MKDTDNQTLQFALCLDNEGYPASLEVGKLYQMIPDDEAATHGYLRIIDESGEEYAFTASRFHLMNSLWPLDRPYCRRPTHRGWLTTHCRCDPFP